MIDVEPWDETAAALLVWPAPIHHRYMADGTHDGVRWWVEDVDGYTHPLLTIVGLEPRLSWQGEVPGCCKGDVVRIVAREMARVAT